MRRHANKAIYVLGAVGAAVVVQLVGELFGTRWQISTATLLVLSFTAAVTFVINGRVRDAAQQTRVVKSRLGDLQKLAAVPQVPRVIDTSAADTAAAILVGVEKLADSHAALDARVAHLTQISTQVAVEMDFLLGVLRQDQAHDGSATEAGAVR